MTFVFLEHFPVLQKFCVMSSYNVESLPFVPSSTMATVTTNLAHSPARVYGGGGMVGVGVSPLDLWGSCTAKSLMQINETTTGARLWSLLNSLMYRGHVPWACGFSHSVCLFWLWYGLWPQLLVHSYGCGNLYTVIWQSRVNLMAQIDHGQNCLHQHHIMSLQQCYSVCEPSGKV
jgi:hypothetical protein